MLSCSAVNWNFTKCCSTSSLYKVEVLFEWLDGKKDSKSSDDSLLFSVFCWFYIRDWVCGRFCIFVFQHNFCVFIFVPAVLAVHPTLPGGVQTCALEQASHEGQPLPSDVGLSGEEVEHRIGTAADEGDGGGNCSTPFPYLTQPFKKKINRVRIKNK